MTFENSFITGRLVGEAQVEGPNVQSVPRRNLLYITMLWASTVPFHKATPPSTHTPCPLDLNAGIIMIPWPVRPDLNPKVIRTVILHYYYFLDMHFCNYLKNTQMPAYRDGSRLGEFAETRKATLWEMKCMQKENGSSDDVEAEGN